MSTNVLDYHAIDRSIRTLKVSDETFAASTTIAGALKIYSAVKPLLEATTTLPFFPPAWRAALKLFVEVLDAVAANPDFKAGKDL